MRLCSDTFIVEKDIVGRLQVAAADQSGGGGGEWRRWRSVAESGGGGGVWRRVAAMEECGGGGGVWQRWRSVAAMAESDGDGGEWLETVAALNQCTAALHHKKKPCLLTDP